MKKPSSQFLDPAIASRLGERELKILAEAEEFQHWDYERQIVQPKGAPADRTLEWLEETFELGCSKYGFRWSVWPSILQALSEIYLDDTSVAATRIRWMDDLCESIFALVRNLPFDERDELELLQIDAMGQQTFCTCAFFALVESPGADVEQALIDAAETTIKDVLGHAPKRLS